MCGFTGVLCSIVKKDLEQTTRNMTETIHHRGPDDVGVWADESVGIVSLRDYWWSSGRVVRPISHNRIHRLGLGIYSKRGIATLNPGSANYYPSNVPGLWDCSCSRSGVGDWSIV